MRRTERLARESAMGALTDSISKIPVSKFVVCLIFQAIIYVFQEFVLECDQSLFRFPPVPTSISRRFGRRDLDADSRTAKLATKNPAHSASRKDLAGNDNHRSGIPLGPLLEGDSLISGVLACGSKYLNSTSRYAQLQEYLTAEFAL